MPPPPPTPPPCPHCYGFGPFRLVPEERLLVRDNQVVHLTPKVFDTLVALVQNRGRLLPKRELLELIWPDTVVEENNLTQAICAIRKALGGSDHNRDYIETVPKQGYRFVAVVRTDDAGTCILQSKLHLSRNGKSLQDLAFAVILVTPLKDNSGS